MREGYGYSLGPMYNAGVIAASMLVYRLGLAFQPLQTFVGLAYGVVWVDAAFLLVALFALLLLHVSDDLVRHPATSEGRGWMALMKDNLYQQLSIARSPTVISLMGANVRCSRGFRTCWLRLWCHRI